MIVGSLLLSVLFPVISGYVPVVFWHGFANAYTVKSIEEIKNNLAELHPGMYVKLLQIGDDVMQDFLNSIMMHPDDQIKIACNLLRSDLALRNGYVGIGFSQGGLLLRGLAQRCPHPRMIKMITMGSMHQGVYGFPHCSVEYLVCRLLRRVNTRLLYTDFVQRHFVPATFWHYPHDSDQYRRRNSFLADINNENSINEDYVANLNALDKFVMVRYTNEHFVVPAESEWFGYYKENSSSETVTLRESEDRLGLKRMLRDGKLDFLTVPWNHVEFHWGWFKDNIVDKYLI